MLCAVMLCGFIPQGMAQALNHDAAAVIRKPDGTYAQYTTLREAVQAVPYAGEATIEIVRDMTIAEPMDIENRKIKLTAAEAHTVTFDLPDDAASRNGFRVAGYSTPSSLAIGDNLTVTTTNRSLRSIVNVGGQQGSFSLEGGILSSGSADLTRAIVCVDNGGTVLMSGGTVRGNKDHNSRGFFLQDTNGWKMDFTMTGGTITDCSWLDKNTYKGAGGGVLIIGNAHFTMNGGAITKCNATGQGGGVAIFDHAAFTMNDGTIESCSSGSGGYVYAAQGTSFIIHGGTVGSVERDGAAQIGNQKYVSLHAAINAAAMDQDEPTTIRIVKDMTITEPVDIENRKIKLEAGEAHTITFDLPDDAASRNCFRVAGYSIPSSLTIGDNLTVTTTNRSLRSIVNVGGQQGSFSLEGGILSSGSAELTKAIVCVDNGGTVSMSSGEVRGNKGHNSCGFLLQDTSKDGWEMAFTMSGGTITDCSSSDKGAGVLAMGNAKFIMDGGKITQCSATWHGGGVAILERATFMMRGGEISACTAVQGGGGGVFAKDDAAFTLSGGKISSCEAINNGAVGGGIYLRGKNITFTMSGGIVCDNTAEYTGGGICTESDATITAGTIQNNRATCATGFGGGIYVHKEATLKLTNVVITDNAATALGGGIWSCRTGDIKIYIQNGGAVFDNRAEDENRKTPEQAGDDIASTVTFPASGFLLISHRMLGGGANRYYVDGGVTGFSTAGLDHHHGEGLGLGSPDGTTARCDAATSALVTETYIQEAIALKNVVSEAGKTTANREAKLIFSGNSASRGGGIGTNGNLVIGTPDPEPKYGGVKIIKTVQGEKAPAESVEYAFKLWVRNSGGFAVSESASYARAREDGTAETGSAAIGTDGYAFSLKNGESITFSGITGGRFVEIREMTTGDFTTTTSGLTDGICVIFPNNTSEVGFVNTYGVATPAPSAPEPTPNLGDPADNVPRTGDSANPILWAALAGFSLFGMAAALFVGKRHQIRHR